MANVCIKTPDGICEVDVDSRELVLCLKDYLHKLEVDDFDPQAIRKMKDVQAILKELQEGV